MRYQIHKGTKYYGAQTVFEDIQFEIKHNEKIALVGRNGCGKTTLLRCIAKEEELDSGEIHKANDVHIGYLSQITFADETSSVKQELLKVFDRIHQQENQLQELAHQMQQDHSEELLDKYAHAQQTLEEMGGYTYEADMMSVFTKFGFRNEDLTRDISTFSGGQKTRLAFVKLLLSKPDILLLDEPTNHLDIATIEWLEGYIKRYPKAVVLVSHDRMFLDDVADVVYEIEYGVMRRYVGNYSKYVEVKKSDMELQKSAFARQQKEIERMETLIEKFRYKKNKAAFAQSKIKYLDRMERIDDPKSDEKTFHAQFHCKVRGGKRVLETHDLTIGYDCPLCNVNLEIMQGQRIAILGPNGQGKSTLMKTLMHQIPSLSGSFLLGHQIQIGYFDQELAQFQSTNTVLEEAWNDFPDLNRTQIRTALGCFLFTGDDAFKTVDCLSGGEKVRLSFVKLMLSQPNFLLMDEPTNHLDLLGKEALELSLKAYDGTMLFVSHDRYFISKLATSILVIDEGKALFYPLTYQEYTQKDTQPVVNEKKTEVIVTKKTERYINYAKEITKLEKQIEEKESSLEELRDLRFEPEYYHDYHKMNELDDKIDGMHNEISELMKTWEDYSEHLEKKS